MRDHLLQLECPPEEIYNRSPGVRNAGTPVVPRARDSHHPVLGEEEQEAARNANDDRDLPPVGDPPRQQREERLLQRGD